MCPDSTYPNEQGSNDLLKNDEIIIGKWYVIRESPAHARGRRDWAARYGPPKYGQCIADSRKGHKMFQVLVNLDDKMNYPTDAQEHTCRSVIEEYEGESLIPQEGTEAYSEWKDRLFKAASKELQTEQREDRVPTIIRLVGSRFEESKSYRGDIYTNYGNGTLMIKADSEVFDWIADLIEENIFNLKTVNLNEIRV